MQRRKLVMQELMGERETSVLQQHRLTVRGLAASRVPHSGGHGEVMRDAERTKEDSRHDAARGVANTNRNHKRTNKTPHHPLSRVPL